MNMNWYLTGDKHGSFLDIYETPYATDPTTAIIILGDAGINFWLNKRDHNLKREITEHCNCHFYLVRGNHEAKPENLVASHIERHYSPEVKGEILTEKNFPTIHYFLNGAYEINDFKCLVINGAYSVDKWYRLSKNLPWFEDEQLTEQEMKSIEAMNSGKHFDFVLSHTCPYSWRPTDLFLPIVNQSTVDCTMEKWMDELKDKIKWDVWCFGHYHDDRLERPGVQMFYHDIDSMEEVFWRWRDYAETGELNEWWLHKSPFFYMK